ncbi:MAG TPA: phosphatidylserine decarboxylase family protein [Gemmatimonadales bacterium]
MSLAPEGRPFVFAGAAVLLALLAVPVLRGAAWLALPALWLPIAVWIPAFFRDPAREGPRGEHLVIAPADGRVVSVAEVDEPDVIGGRALRIAVFMNVFDVHVNRHPVDGTVIRRDYRPGRFVNASFDKASVDNERMSLGVRSPRGPVLIRQIAGLIARRIVTDPPEGASVRQGTRLGLIRFGSRVDTYLPAGARPRVAVGDRTRAGITVIAEWP